MCHIKVPESGLSAPGNYCCTQCQGPVGTARHDCPWPAYPRALPPCPCPRTPCQHPGAICPVSVTLQQGWSPASHCPALLGPPRGLHPGPGHAPGRCLIPGGWGCPRCLPTALLPAVVVGQALAPRPSLARPWRDPGGVASPLVYPDTHVCDQNEGASEMNQPGARKMVLFLCCLRFPGCGLSLICKRKVTIGGGGGGKEKIKETMLCRAEIK